MPQRRKDTKFHYRINNLCVIWCLRVFVTFPSLNLLPYFRILNLFTSLFLFRQYKLFCRFFVYSISKDNFKNEYFAKTEEPR